MHGFPVPHKRASSRAAARNSRRNQTGVLLLHACMPGGPPWHRWGSRPWAKRSRSRRKEVSTIELAVFHRHFAAGTSRWASVMQRSQATCTLCGTEKQGKLSGNRLIRSVRRMRDNLIDTIVGIISPMHPMMQVCGSRPLDCRRALVVTRKFSYHWRRWQLLRC